MATRGHVLQVAAAATRRRGVSALPVSLAVQASAIAAMVRCLERSQWFTYVRVRDTILLRV